MTVPTKTPAAALLILLGFAVGAEGASYRGAARKVLQRHCVVCHDGPRGSAGLDLSSYTGVLAGGASGEVVVGGAPDDSFLYLVTAHIEEPAMPPGGERVPDADLAALRRWIELGLPETDEDVDPAAMAASTEASPPSASASSPPTPDLDPDRHGPVVAIAASAVADRLAVGRQLGVWLYEASTLRPIGVLPFPEGEPQSLVFSADGAWLTAAGGVHGQSGAVVVWSLRGEPYRAWGWADAYDAVLSADLSPDRRRVVLGGPTRRVRVLSTVSGEEVRSHDKPTDWVLQTRFSPDGLLLAATDRDGGVYVWEAESGALLHSLRGHQDAAVALEWLEGGDRLATASLDGDVRLWDMHTGDSLNRWTAHEAGVAALASNGSGALITLGKNGSGAADWSSEGAIQGTLTAAPPAHLLTVASAGPSQSFFGTLDGRVLVRRGGQTELAAVPTPSGGAPDVLAHSPGPTGPRAALEIAARPRVEALASVRVETEGSGGSSAPEPRTGSGGPSEFELGVRSARLADAIETLRRLEARLEELDTNDSKALQESRLLLGLSRERLERAVGE